MCEGSSCGGLPSAGTIQPRCSPHGCFFQGFHVPTCGYVDGHALWVQHVAMIIVLRGKVLHGLRGRLFGHRSGPGDELVTDHVRGQLLRRAAVRRDDPAALFPPRLLLPGHHTLQSITGPLWPPRGSPGSEQPSRITSRATAPAPPCMTSNSTAS